MYCLKASIYDISWLKISDNISGLVFINIYFDYDLSTGKRLTTIDGHPHDLDRNSIHENLAICPLGICNSLSNTVYMTR